MASDLFSVLTLSHTGLRVGGRGNLYLAHLQHTTTLLVTFLNILLGLLANTNLNNVFILNQNNTVVHCIT